MIEPQTTSTIQATCGTPYARLVPDYLGDLQKAKELAATIQAYWWRRGQISVKVWVEKREDFGTYYLTKSNIVELGLL